MVAKQFKPDDCYVCTVLVTPDVDAYCSKEIDGETRLRHFWHGVPGITRAVGGADSIGFVGYAMTLAVARRRAEYYINSNPYAAPEVKAGEVEILEEVKRLEKLARLKMVQKMLKEKKENG